MSYELQEDISKHYPLHSRMYKEFLQINKKNNRKMDIGYFIQQDMFMAK